MPERFYPGKRAIRDETTGRVFAGPTHHKARDRMERATGRRQPGTEGYETPNGFIPKSEMHERG